MLLLTPSLPTPWSVCELEQAFGIEDANGQAIAYTYFRKDENEARQANVLTWNEADCARMANLSDVGIARVLLAHGDERSLEDT